MGPCGNMDRRLTLLKPGVGGTNRPLPVRNIHNF